MSHIIRHTWPQFVVRDLYLTCTQLSAAVVSPANDHQYALGQQWHPDPRSTVPRQLRFPSTSHKSVLSRHRPPPNLSHPGTEQPSKVYHPLKNQQAEDSQNTTTHTKIQVHSCSEFRPLSPRCPLSVLQQPHFVRLWSLSRLNWLLQELIVSNSANIPQRPMTLVLATQSTLILSCLFP